MKKILIVFGTRPEAIKLAPLIKEIEKDSQLKAKTCVFRQHREMLNQVLGVFNIKPTFDLKVSISDRDLFAKNLNIFSKTINLSNTGLAFLKFFRILKKERPDLLIIQGDTSTAFFASFIAFHFKIPIAHIEAGLRTSDKYRPFPEEINRRLISVLASYHFAPTPKAVNSLLSEGISKEGIFLTGNTGIDALLMIFDRQKSPQKQKAIEEYFRKKWNFVFNDNKKIILVTGHRRENFGRGLENICQALRELGQRNPDLKIIYPLHLNPNVRESVYKILGTGKNNIYLIEPLDYENFIYLLAKSYLILTDSGGIQEEAPYLGKPLLIMRETTERPEVVEAGVAKLVGTDKEKIIEETENLLNDQILYKKMSEIKKIYGSGQASKNIVNILKNNLNPN